VVLLLGLAGVFYYKGSQLKHIVTQRLNGLDSMPPYEQPRELPDQIARIDRAFYVALFRMGVKAEDVRFERVEHHSKDGHEWEQANIRVTLPRGTPPGVARSRINRALAPLGERLTARYEVEDKLGRLELRWDGMLTHRVELREGAGRTTARPREPAKLPRVAIIMDDIGYDLHQVQRLVDLGYPVTCSVLPFSPYGREAVTRASAAGLECLLHLPMEAEGVPIKRLGEGALLMEMDAGQILRGLRDDLGDLPKVSGVNNHMGSAFTANEPRMKVILAELKRRGLFFVDSRTTSRSQGYRLAEEMGVRSAGRDVFLDVVQDKEAILAQLGKLVSMANSKGEAVAICHPYPATFAALSEALPQLKGNVKLVPVSALVH